MSVWIICDTSCLIALDRINQLNLLQELFQQIVITREVKEEFGKKSPEWIQIVEVRDTVRLKELENILDKGEASTIALALETDNCLLIIDEKKGRRFAQSLNIKIIGTLKVIQIAKQKGIIKAAQPIIEALQKAGFRFSDKIIKILLSDE